MNAPVQEDFAALIAAIARCQDREAFSRLFRHFAPRVKAWLLKRGATMGLADELAQETLLAVWRKADRFDAAKAAPATWIFVIARNLYIDRTRRDHHPSELLETPNDEADSAPRADAILAREERETRLRHALAELPADQARVVSLAFFQDKPHAEIERALGIPLGTVKSRLRLAMNRLRAALEDLAP